MGIDETGSSNIGAIWAVRQGQQNRRGRGRNNNNRKNHNPLARSFESNGPDVKIRGTPAHIAEKYLTLSRDAQTSGDPVLAENYLQHAEHYIRIIMAYREQLQQPGDMANGNGQRLREPGDGDEFGDDETATTCSTRAFAPQHQPPRRTAASGAAPLRRRTTPTATIGPSGATRAASAAATETAAIRGGDRDRGDRDRGDRDRPMEGRPPRRAAGAPVRSRRPAGGQPRAARSEPAARGAGGEPRRRDRFQQPHEQPEFLRRPVRRARSESEPATPPPPRTSRRAIDARRRLTTRSAIRAATRRSRLRCCEQTFGVFSFSPGIRAKRPGGFRRPASRLLWRRDISRA